MKKMLRFTTSDLDPDWQTQCMKHRGYRLEKLNTLAFPKGKTPLCEITGQPSSVQMITPYVTLFFATREDALASWEAIMWKLCPLLGPLRDEPEVVGSEEDRKRRKRTYDMSLRALIEMTSEESSTLLRDNKPRLAIPAALQALKFTREVYGEGSVKLVPSFLLLAEAYIAMKKVSRAESFLTKANVCALKNESECTNDIKAQLHRNFGRVYMTKGRLSSALKQLAYAVYYSSLHSGPEHVETSRGYYECAIVFFEMHKIEQGLAFFDRVVDIWFKLLASLQNEDKIDEDKAGDLQDLLANRGLEMLTRVFETRAKYLGDTHIATGEAQYTLGLLHLFMGRTEDAAQQISNAASTYSSELGEDHPSTRDILQVLTQIQEETRDDGNDEEEEEMDSKEE